MIEVSVNTLSLQLCPARCRWVMLKSKGSKGSLGSHITQPYNTPLEDLLDDLEDLLDIELLASSEGLNL
jgi:hypothetical protein